jgi:hypothetical protein
MLRPLCFKLPALLVAIGQFCLLTAAAQNDAVVEVYSENAPSSTPDNGDDGTDGADVSLWRLPAKITLSAGAGYDDNSKASSLNKDGSYFTYGRANLVYQFGTSRTRASLRTHTAFRYYPEGGRNGYDPDVNLAFSVNHAVNRRLSLSADVDLRYQIEPDFEIDGSLNQQSGNYFYSRAMISLSYQWLPRFSTSSSYTFRTFQYDDEAIGAIRDRFDHSFGQQLHYLWLPTTQLTGGYTFSVVDYGMNERDSLTHSLYVGVHHTIGPRLSGSLQVGAQSRSFDQPVSGTNEHDISPYFDASLSYVLGSQTSINWNTRYSMDGFDSPSGVASRNFRTGLRLHHDITRRIRTNLALDYRRYSNVGMDGGGAVNLADFGEDALDITVGLSYSINRLLSMSGSYHFTHVESDSALKSYSRSRYTLGLSSTF